MTHPIYTSLGAEIEEALGQPNPLLLAWQILERVWEEADAAWFSANSADSTNAAIDRQLECLLVREQLRLLTADVLESNYGLWRSVVALVDRLPDHNRAWPLSEMAEGLEESELLEFVGLVESLSSTSESVFTELVPLLVERGHVNDALRLSGRISQPFCFLKAARALAPVIDHDRRVRLANDAWDCAADYAWFDQFGPGYITALWLDCISLWPIDHPARRQRLVWLEHRVRVLPLPDRHGSQDFPDPHYRLAECWAEMGEFQHALSWINAPDLQFYQLRLAPRLPVEHQRAIAESAFETELSAKTDVNFDYVPYTMLENIGALGHGIADSIIARIQDHTDARFTVENRHMWLLSMSPELSDSQAHLLWDAAFEYFEQSAAPSMDEALDGLLEELVDTAAHASDGDVRLLDWLVRWPRAAPLTGVFQKINGERMLEAARRVAARDDVSPDDNTWKFPIRSAVALNSALYFTLPVAWQCVVPKPKDPNASVEQQLQTQWHQKPGKPWLSSYTMSSVLLSLPNPLRRTCFDIYIAHRGLSNTPEVDTFAQILCGTPFEQAAYVAVTETRWIHSFVNDWFENPSKALPKLGAIDTPEAMCRWLAEQPEKVVIATLDRLHGQARELFDAWTKLPPSIQSTLQATFEQWLSAHHHPLRNEPDVCQRFGEPEQRIAPININVLLSNAKDGPSFAKIAHRVARFGGRTGLLIRLLKKHTKPHEAVKVLAGLMEDDAIDEVDRTVINVALEACVLELMSQRVCPELHNVFCAFPWLSPEVLSSIWSIRACAFATPERDANVSEFMLAILLGGPERLSALLKVQSQLLAPTG